MEIILAIIFCVALPLAIWTVCDVLTRSKPQDYAVNVIFNLGWKEDD